MLEKIEFLDEMRVLPHHDIKKKLEIRVRVENSIQISNFSTYKLIILRIHKTFMTGCTSCKALVYFVSLFSCFQKFMSLFFCHFQHRESTTPINLFTHHNSYKILILVNLIPEIHKLMLTV